MLPWPCRCLSDKKAGSGAVTLGVPNSPGVTKGTAQDTLLAPYNDIDAVKRIVSENKDEIAAIILEPVAGNMGCIPPNNAFLQSLRLLCDKHKIVLIFDEVMTGFRLSKGGVGERFNVMPDMVTLGKIIGGGMPVGAFGGKRNYGYSSSRRPCLSGRNFKRKSRSYELWIYTFKRVK